MKNLADLAYMCPTMRSMPRVGTIGFHLFPILENPYQTSFVIRISASDPSLFLSFKRLFDKKKLVLQVLSQAITVDKGYSVYKYIYVINYGFNELKDY